ncbi:16S rRNA (guanine(527)-N(7))-methyltransferase RsmG [bacterium]|nr:16S rRNA (guanine(527)-N(7))-methyltransferase RsmG [bacterium]
MNWLDLVPALAKLEVALDGSALERLRALHAIVIAKNESLNLTRIVAEEDFVEKHLLDSLAGLAGVAGDRETSAAPRVIDIGSGAGFPGLPLAIARPRSRVVLLESTRKKAVFLEEAARALGLENVSVKTARAEDAARESGFRDSFDRATVRALGPVALALEYALPFLRAGGTAVLYCGPESDLEPASRVSQELGGGEPAVFSHELPRAGSRRLLLVPKVAPTPGRFPRRAGAAAKRPLRS